MRVDNLSVLFDPQLLRKLTRLDINGDRYDLRFAMQFRVGETELPVFYRLYEKPDGRRFDLRIRNRYRLRGVPLQQLPEAAAALHFLAYVHRNAMHLRAMIRDEAPLTLRYMRDSTLRP